MWWRSFHKFQQLQFLLFIIISFMLFDKIIISSKTNIIKDETRLRSDLLAGPLSRPSIYHGNSTLVTIGPIYQGFEFNEDRSILTLYCEMVLLWKDEHLTWNSDDYGNLSMIHFKPNEVWIPDLSIYNNVDTSDIGLSSSKLPIFVSPTGNMYWLTTVSFQIACSTDTRYWPNDNHTCYIKLGSWAHNGQDIDLAILVVQGGLKNPDWEIISNSMKVRRFNYAGIPYPDVLFTINIKRKSGVHSALILIPAFAIKLSVLISFWLHPASVSRFSIIVMSILINSMYLFNVYGSVPRSGDSTPLVLLFYRDSLLMVSIALLWTIIFRQLANTKRISPVPLPSFFTSFLHSYPAKILCLNPRPNLSQGGGGENCFVVDDDDDGKLINVSRNPIQVDWAWLAHLLDQVVFLIYLIVYISFYVALL